MEISEGLQDQLKAAAVLGAFAWVFNSIGGLQHGQDTMLKDVTLHTKQFVNIWGKYDKNEEDEKIKLKEEKVEMKEEFAVYKDIMKRLHDTEQSIKDAEIGRLKEKIDEKSK